MHSNLAIHLLSRSNAYAHTHIHAKEYSVAGCAAFKNKKRYTQEIEAVVAIHLDRGGKLVEDYRIYLSKNPFTFQTDIC